MYCAGNPVLYKDPSGHFKEVETYSNEVVDSGGTSKHYYSYHGEVEKGDNLSSIAKKYIEMELDRNNLTCDEELKNKLVHEQVEKMKELNGLTTDTIQPGQELLVNEHMYNITEPGMTTPLVDPLDFVPVGLIGKFAYNATSKVALKGSQKLSAKIIATQASKAITVSTKNGVRLYGEQQLKRTPINLLKAYINPSNSASRKVIGEKVLGKAGYQTANKATTIAGKGIYGVAQGFIPGYPSSKVMSDMASEGVLAAGAAVVGYKAGGSILDTILDK